MSVMLLAQPDLGIVDATERHHRRPGPLGTETRKRLRVAALMKGRERKHFRRGDHALAAASMDANLKHRAVPRDCRERGDCSGNRARAR